MLEEALTFAAAFALYAFGAAPTVTFGDSGEFAAAAAGLGLPHAPDYPAYTLGARAFGTLLPLGNWAYRTNLFSAACAAAALALLDGALRRLGVSRAARLVPVAVLAVTPLWRLSAGVTEVFALHWLLCAALLWLLARFEGGLAAVRPAAALGLVFGLGAGVHHTLALAAPAVVAQSACEPAGWRRRARAALVLLVFAAAGLAAYAYLPIRAVKRPPLDWDQPVDAPRFFRALLRKDYGSLSLTVDGRAGSGDTAAEGVLAQLERWTRESARQLGWPLLAAAALGLSAAWLPVGARAGAAVWVLCAGPLFLWLGQPPFDAQTSSALERFYGASWLGLAVLAAVALEALLRRGRGLGLAAAAALLLPLLRPGVAAGVSERGDWAAYDYGVTIQDQLPRGAALFMDGGDDTFYSLAFLEYAQRRREDVELHDRGAVVFPSAYGEGFRTVPKAAKEAVRQAVERPLAESGRLFYSTLNPGLLAGFELRPWGLLRRPLRPGAASSDAALWETAPWRFDERLLRAHYRDRGLAALYPVQRALSRGERGEYRAAAADLALALDWAPDALWAPGAVSYVAGVAGYRAAQQGRWDEADALYAVWMRAAPESAEPRLDRGVAAERRGKPQDAERLYREAVAAEPSSAAARYSLGAALYRAGRYAEAADQLQEARRLRPDDPTYARWAAEAARRRR